MNTRVELKRHSANAPLSLRLPLMLSIFLLSLVHHIAKTYWSVIGRATTPGNSVSIATKG